jgi:hypothetical protein
MMCRGICGRYKANWRLHTDRYANGQKRCNECGIFIMWEGVHCPCCGLSLRTRPRTRKYKQKFHLKIQNK